MNKVVRRCWRFKKNPGARHWKFPEDISVGSERASEERREWAIQNDRNRIRIAPAFEVNMQLADRGPEMRFMTSMAVLYQGKSFVIKPWTLKGKRAELIAHFEALGAKVNIDAPNWTFTIELCAQHSISFATRHSDGINFLNLEVSVPGCHDAYGGLLGQTYQCKYAHEKFEWSREREEAFRVATLETASDMYSPLATCAHEDEYRGEAIRGGSFSNGTLSMTTML
jgi:hypothetical protein